MDAAQPNFLFLITDQQRADHLGCYGNQVINTPNVDAISARGLTYDQFYVACPICMPNRAALMTGRMPSVNGVMTNGVPLPLESTTFVELLRAAGRLPGNAEAHNNLGTVLQASGDLDGAVASYRRAIEYAAKKADRVRHSRT